jgi:hypothetical protein
MIKRHDIRPRRKRGGAANRSDAENEPDDLNDEGEEVGVD